MRARRRIYEPSLAELRAEQLAAGRSAARRAAEIALLWLDTWRVHLFDRPGSRTTSRRAASPSPTRRDLSETLMHSFLLDLRYALRSLRSSPGFAVVAVLTLGVGIGVNAVIFGVVDAFLWRDLGGIRAPEKLVWVMTRSEQTPILLNQSYPNYEDLRDNTEVFDAMIAYGPLMAGIRVGEGTAERMFAATVSDNFFDVLGVRPAAGRMFSSAEVLGEGSPPVMVISHDYWSGRFGSDPDVVGSVVEINGAPVTIVGVAEREFLGIETMLGVQMYVPASTTAQVHPATAVRLAARRSISYRVLGVLADGVTVADAGAAMNALAASLREAYPEENEDLAIVVMPEKSGRPDPSAAGGFAGIAAVFMGLVGLVLVIACANIANLMLARAVGRDRELAVRTALGAPRFRLVRQLVGESAMLGVAGGIVGVALAVVGTGAVRAMIAQWNIGIPVRLPVEVDPRLAAFGVLLAITAGVLTGVLPALQAGRRSVTAALSEGSREASTGPRRQRLRSALVVAQVAVSVVLLTLAGLFVRSVQNAGSVGLGFSPDQRLLVSVDPGLADHDAETGGRLYADLVKRVRALPGVESAGLAAAMPFGVRMGFTDIYPEEGNPDDAVEFAAVLQSTPGYLEAAGTRLLRGREFTEADNGDGAPVAIVNEALARRYWPGQDAIGQRFSTRRPDGPLREVVGVVETGKYSMIWEDQTAAVLLPIAQLYAETATLVVHATGDPLRLAGAIRSEVALLDPDVPVFDVQTFDQYLRFGRALMIVRLASALVTTFGLIGIALAAVGLYGVISYAVGQRTREFGVRMAMGAATPGLLRMVLRQGLRLAVPGMLLGALVAFASSRAVANLLIATSPSDPATYASGVVLVLVVTVVACLVPAWRASRIDPVEALRAD